MSRVDLNCDLGEIPALVATGVDDALAASVTSINLACGGHAGDDTTMDRLVALAARIGARVGAHPSYPDRAGFGRVPTALTPDQVRATVREQLEALVRVARRHGVTVTHVKPHGALYHASAHHADVAEAVLLATRDTPGYEHAALVGPCAAPALDWWRTAGAHVLAEAFADRAYEPDGTLRARTLPGAVIEDPALAAGQAVRIALEHRVVSHMGEPVPLHADTLCLHGDAPGAVERVRAVRAALEGAGVTLG
jgi:UPF0271 protein